MSQRKKKSRSNELPGSRVRLTFRQHLLPLLVGAIAFASVFGFFDSDLLTGRIVYALHEGLIRHNVPEETAPARVVGKNAPPRIEIRKLNIDVPVVFDDRLGGNDSFQAAFQHGVAHYRHTAEPGQTGNSVIVGQSSDQWWAPGKYRFIFTLLNKLDYGDEIAISFQGVRYVYRVYNRLTVASNDTSILNQGGSHMLTLLTCTPIGTSNQRLAIQAQQVIPNAISGTPFTRPAALPAGVAPQTTLPCAPSFWSDLGNLVGDMLGTNDVAPVLPNPVDVTKLTKQYDFNKRLQKHP